MDSPVIVDTASKFGRGIDLDRSFPGFPFDDDGGFSRRGDIRAHLDDLASRHPEFADHLLGPPWGDIPFHGSLRNRRRGSGSGGSGYQGYPDEDTRSQTSGSSATSAASGASGVSSHGDPESSQNHYQSRQAPEAHQETRRNPIPQYGLRNTVDIGQQRHNMEYPDKVNRGQRSMSAPPENRQQQPQQYPPDQQHQQPSQGQRFVSRVDITPQHNQQQTQASRQQQQPQQQQSQQQQPRQQQPQQQQPQQPSPSSQQQSNVRHIPIFVEGRDEPVIPKNIDQSHFQRQPSPPQFQKPSHFNQHYGGRQHQWTPHFQDPFYQQHRTFEHSPTRRTQQQQAYNYPQQQQHHPRQQYAERHRPEPPQQQQKQYEQYQRQQPKQQQDQSQQQQQQEPPKPKLALPKDPLERVAAVQKEVDALAEQVKRYSGNSGKDKEYIYLDEMLTRELIKLDDIETEGRDNVRQARRNAIKTIQETISLLESKALPSGPQGQQNEEKEEVQYSQNSATSAEECKQEAMDVEQKQEQATQSTEPIPLPPASLSPSQVSSENSGDAIAVEASTHVAQQQDVSADQTINSQNIEQTQMQQQQNDTTKTRPSSEPPMDTGSATVNSTGPTDVHQSVESVTNQRTAEQNEKEPASAEKKSENVPEDQPTTDNEQSNQSAKVEDKMQVDNQTCQLSKSPKKVKKTKKQAPPVSEKPIPLPPPESTEATEAK